MSPRHADILSAPALSFLAELHRALDGPRKALLATPEARADAAMFAVPEASLVIEEGALLADFEDIERPRFADVVEGQIALNERATSAHAAIPLVRPRAWHRLESQVRVDGAPIAAALFDVGLAVFHNVRPLIARGARPVFHLPAIATRREAQLWNALFVCAQELSRLPLGVIRAAVPIASLPAEEAAAIVYELRDHIVALPAGEWEAAADSFFKVFVPSRSL